MVQGWVRLGTREQRNQTKAARTLRSRFRIGQVVQEMRKFKAVKGEVPGVEKYVPINPLETSLVHSIITTISLRVVQNDKKNPWFDSATGKKKKPNTFRKTDSKKRTKFIRQQKKGT